jgi:hypothetical protein
METIRTLTAAALVPFMKLTGFRFSKDYRWGVSRFHRAVYVSVNVIKANYWAGI